MYTRKNKTYKKRRYNFRTRRVRKFGLAKRVRWLAQRMDGELKFKDTPITGNISTSGFSSCLTNPDVGTQPYNRIGNLIRLKRITYKYSIRQSAPTPDVPILPGVPQQPTDTQVRLVIVLDKQQVNDTTPIWADVFQSSRINSLINPATRGRFKILSDKIFKMNNMNNSLIEMKGVHYVHNKVRFNGQYDNDLQKNHIYCMAISQVNQSTTPLALYPTIDASYRCYFYDN